MESATTAVGIKDRISQKDAQASLSMSKHTFMRIRDKLQLDFLEQGNFKYYLVSDLHRVREYAKMEQRGVINVTQVMRVLNIGQHKLYPLMEKLGIVPAHSNKSSHHNEKLITVHQFNELREHYLNKNQEVPMNEDVLEQFASVKKYSLKDAAAELGISEKELISYHEEKLGNGKIGFRMEWIEDKPLCFTEMCLEQVREHKASLIEQHKERLDNRQMEEAVHESLKEVFSNNVNPKFSKLESLLSKQQQELLDLIANEVRGIKASQSETTSELHHNMDALAKAVQLLQHSLAGIEERLVQHTETLTMILDPLTDPKNQIQISTEVTTSTDKPVEEPPKVVVEAKPVEEREITPSQGELWYPNQETHQPALKPTESVEDFDSTFRKMGPENLRFNNTLTYDECKKALDMYKSWITTGKLPADRKLRKLTELSNHIRHRLRTHFKSNPNGMTMTEFSNNVKAAGPWSSKTVHAVKRAALGMLYEKDELTIVFGKTTGGRAPTFLFHSEDYTQLTLSQAKQGLINPNGYSDLPN